MLKAGIEGAQEFVVDGALLTDVRGSLPFSVLSTPGMISMMEWTATSLVSPLLEEGQATVGFEVCIKHVAGARQGLSCTARARLEEVVDGRKLRFAVEVVDENGRTIGVGTHERRIVAGVGAA
jgi:predicted thioesterase